MANNRLTNNAGIEPERVGMDLTETLPSLTIADRSRDPALAIVVIGSRAVTMRVSARRRP